jgi:hypothetical protein
MMFKALSRHGRDLLMLFAFHQKLGADVDPGTL